MKLPQTKHVSTSEKQYSGGDCPACGSQYFIVRIEKTQIGRKPFKTQKWKWCGDCAADLGD